jgi:hypothetical protein
MSILMLNPDCWPLNMWMLLKGRPHDFVTAAPAAALERIQELDKILAHASVAPPSPQLPGHSLTSSICLVIVAVEAHLEIRTVIAIAANHALRVDRAGEDLEQLALHPAGITCPALKDSPPVGARSRESRSPRVERHKAIGFPVRQIPIWTDPAGGDRHDARLGMNHAIRVAAKEATANLDTATVAGGHAGPMLTLFGH